LFGGESQSGLTTTSYAILSQHDSYLNNIVTLEKQVLATLEGITHNDTDDDNYATQLQTVIRRDPDVILAADLSDSESAKIVAKPGKDGPLIFVSMRASSMSDLLSKWAGLVSNPRQSFDGLQAVVFQKLVRILCENCRVAYKPSPDLAKQGLPIDTVEQLYRMGGTIEHKNKTNPCPICEGTGYIGQVGVFETMFLDKETRRYLIAGDLKGALSNARRTKRLIRLQDAAWHIVASGKTSLEEFGRVNKKKSSKKTTTSST
jgi:type II secretory ATPase GspE/PulE/Tfp pilus assembly ATPase PilB-like protein